MKTKSIIATILSLCMLLSSVTSLAHVGYNDDIIAREDFDGYPAGSIPSGAVSVTTSGGGRAVVTPMPDYVNKSLRISTASATDTAGITLTVINAGGCPLSIAFSLYMPSFFATELVQLVCNEGTLNLMNTSDYELHLASGVWHSVELLLSSGGNKVTVLIDGEVSGTQTIAFSNISAVKFTASGASNETYIDDIYISKASDRALENKGDYHDTDLFLTDDEYNNANDIMQTAVIMHQNYARASLGGRSFVLPVAPYEADGKVYVPLRVIAEALGAEVIWQARDGGARVLFAGRSMMFSPHAGNAELRGGTLCAPAQELSKLLGRDYYSKYSFIFIGSGVNALLGASDKVRSEVKNSAKYERPTGAELVAKLSEHNPNNAHPRLLGTKADFDRAKALTENDEIARKMYAHLQKRANEMLTTSAAEYSIKEKIRLGDAGTLMPDRIYTLAMMWRLSGGSDSGKKYAARAWEELSALCNFPDWNHQHYLDTGSLMNAAAVGYDWLYDYLTDEQKATLRAAMIEKGIQKGLAYMTGTNEPTTAMTSWYTSAFNWNSYCNAGLIMCALAIGDEESAIAETVLDYSLRSIEHHLNEYEPDGGWEEGIGYWNDTVYSLVRIISSIESALGSDYGYLSVAGIKETCYFYLYMLGPAGGFNYGDSAPLAQDAVLSQFWMAKKLCDPYLGYCRTNYLENHSYKCEATDLLWYDPQWCGDGSNDLATDKYFRKIETVTMRSSWNDDAMFAGLHSGRFTNHSHYDTGSYVLDWGGERWAYETGTDRATYTGVTAAEVYRTRAEGHNTIVMDASPYPSYETNTDGWLEMLDMNFDDAEPGSEPDLEVSNRGSGTSLIVSENASGNNSLRLACTFAEAGNQALVQKLMAYPYINTGISVNFKVMREDLNGDVYMPEFQSASGATENFSALKFGADGILYYKAEDATYKAVAGYNTNTWYDFTIKLDIANQTMTVYVGDYEEVKASPLPVNMSNVYFARFFLARKNSAYRIDDLRICVHSDDVETIVSTLNNHQQNVNAVCLIDRFETSSDAVVAITDMTAAYNVWASSAVRGVKLSNSKSRFTVRDEIALKQKADVYWFNHISSDTAVDIAADGRSAVMSKRGKKMWVGIVSDTDAVIECVVAEPLPTSPNPDGQIDNSAFKKLRIKCEGVTSVTLEVAFVPLTGDTDAPDAVPVPLPIGEWKIN